MTPVSVTHASLTQAPVTIDQGCCQQKMPRRPGRQRQQGFSFFEVLIAALILGVAVLGFAALQVRALDTTGVSHFRSQAAVLAADLSERIRMIAPVPDGTPAPPAPQIAPLTVGQVLTAWEENQGIPAAPPATLDPGVDTCIYDALNAAGCNRNALLVSDIAEVRYLADELLPAGNIDVRQCAAGSRLVCIFVAWRGRNAADCAQGDIDLDCYSTQVLF